MAIKNHSKEKAGCQKKILENRGVKGELAEKLKIGKADSFPYGRLRLIE